MTTRVTFIGNRVPILDICLEQRDWTVGAIYALAGSLLETALRARGIPHIAFTFAERDAVVRGLEADDFDCLVSNGCPFVLPLDRLQRAGRLFVNTHPALLPGISGPHPINALFLWNAREFGATTHLMTAEVDAGDVLGQARMALTPDLDAGLVYRLAFQLEAEAFRQALPRLTRDPAGPAGTPQDGTRRYYKRRPDDLQANAARESAVDIATKIRAFGIASLGVTLATDRRSYRVFDATAITNPGAVSRLGRGTPGAVILEYDGTLLIETADGLLRLIRYTPID